MFYPKAGDTIVCNNGMEYRCVNRENYPHLVEHPFKSIYAVSDRYGSHMNWDTHEGISRESESFNISRIVPAAENSIETKALCSVLRKAESQGERSLVEKMIEICDTQSGLRFEQLWDWWKKHKQEDAYKIVVDFKIRDPLTEPLLQQFDRIVHQAHKTTVTC